MFATIFDGSERSDGRLCWNILQERKVQTENGQGYGEGEGGT